MIYIIYNYKGNNIKSIKHSHNKNGKNEVEIFDCTTKISIIYLLNIY